MSTQRRASLAFILVTVMLDVLGFGLLIPVAPKLIESLIEPGAGLAGGLIGGLGAGVGEAAAAAGSGGAGNEQVVERAAQWYGLLIALFAVMNFLFSPVLGALSDRYGRRVVLLTALFGSGLDYFAMALSPTLWFLFITRAINGMSGASVTVCNAYIADVTPPEKRAAAFGMLGAAFGLGFIIGPLMGGLLAAESIRIPLVGWTYHGGIHVPFFVAGGVALTNWLYGCFVLPESLPPERRSHLSVRRMNPVAVFAHVGKYPLVAGLGAALFFSSLAMYGLHSTWVLYTGKRYGWEPLQVGLSLALVGFLAAIVQGGLARKIIPVLGPGAVGEKRALLLGLGVAVVSYIGYGTATHGWMIFAVICFAALGGIAQPALQALITKTVDRHEQGAVQGALTGVQSVAQVIGPLIATQVFAWAIADARTTKIPGASFYVGAALSAVGLTISWVVMSRRHVAERAWAAGAAGSER